MTDLDMPEAAFSPCRLNVRSKEEVTGDAYPRLSTVNWLWNRAPEVTPALRHPAGVTRILSAAGADT